MSDERPKKRLVSFADIAARQTAAPVRPKTVPPGGEEPEKRVTYADLAALSRRPEDFGPAKESGTPEPTPPTAGTPAKGAPEAGHPARKLPGIPPATAPVVTTPVGGVPVSGAPDAGIRALLGVRPPLRAGGPHVRYAMRARDGHSPGEQAVYQALWSAGSPYAENCRIVTVGYRSLSRLCGLTVNNCKANLRGLLAKLAIEEAGGHSYTQATTYLVHGESAILKRRRAAGLTHYIKSRGVVFVDAETGEETGVPETGIADSESGGAETGAPD